MVDDVELAVAFYTAHLGFTLLSSTLPAFADVTRGDLRLLLSGPASSAGRPMPDGGRPSPGGWNRIHLIVEDLVGEVERLRHSGLSFRSDIVTGPGGSQIVLDDPSGNPVIHSGRSRSWLSVRRAGSDDRHRILGTLPPGGDVVRHASGT
jgi:catechol 2,3-dioxygenase-like lactoylglutathione lyase family enzyme